MSRVAVVTGAARGIGAAVFVGVVFSISRSGNGSALMDERKRSWAEAAEYQIVLLRVESAFEACERLPHDDRLSLLKEVAPSARRVGVLWRQD